jgi:hypothetical protein
VAAGRRAGQRGQVDWFCAEVFKAVQKMSVKDTALEMDLLLLRRLFFETAFYLRFPKIYKSTVFLKKSHIADKSTKIWF